MKARTLSLFFFALCVSACSQSHQTGEDGGVPPDGFLGVSDAPYFHDAQLVDAFLAPPDAAIACDLPAPIARACSSDDQCAMALHRADCCGTGEWVGVTEGGREAFEAYVDACEPLQPLCDCIAGPTRADDGTDETLAGALLRVACVDGSCTTTYR